MEDMTLEEVGKMLRDRYTGPLLASDIIIKFTHPERGFGVVLIDRVYRPYGLAIPGGFMEEGLSIEENAIKEAKEETNLDVTLDTPNRPLWVYSDPKRDPRTPIAAVIYTGTGTGILRAGDDAKTTMHVTIDELKQIPKERFAVPDQYIALHLWMKEQG